VPVLLGLLSDRPDFEIRRCAKAYDASPDFVRIETLESLQQPAGVDFEQVTDTLEAE
jgi:hypothetical protein